jgi:hypothetical protein
MKPSGSAVCHQGQTHSQVAINGTKKHYETMDQGQLVEECRFRHMSVQCVIEMIFHKWYGLVECQRLPTTHTRNPKPLPHEGVKSENVVPIGYVFPLKVLNRYFRSVDLLID